MEQQNIFNSKNISTIFFITIIIIILGLIVSFLQTPKYKSSTKLLVVFSQENMSPYSSAQTSNYIAGILTEVIYSDSFIDNVFKTSFDLEKNIGFNQEQKMKNWKKMVKISLQENKGIIIVDVYHEDSKQANNFAQAIGYTLITNHSLYHGSGDNVVIKMIGTPGISDKWATPNIAQNTLLSLITGIFISLTFILIFPEQELINYILGKKSIKKDETIYFENNSENKENTSEEDPQNKEGYYNW